MKKIAIFFIILLPIIYCTMKISEKLVSEIKNPSVLGPTDTPNFHTMEWKKIQVSYWIRVEFRRKKRRMFSIEDLQLLQSLRDKIKIRNISPNSLANDGQLIITTKNGNKWLGSIILKKQLNICKKSDKGYSYRIYLKDYSLYNTLMEYCITHEKKLSPGLPIKRKHIILSRSKGVTEFDILPIDGQKSKSESGVENVNSTDKINLIQNTENEKMFEKIFQTLVDEKGKFPREHYKEFFALAKNKKTPPYILKELSQHYSSSVRWAVAVHPNTHIEDLVKLSEDSSSLVRTWVCHNPKTPLNILKKLAQDSDKNVRRHAKDTLKNRLSENSTSEEQ